VRVAKVRANKVRAGDRVVVTVARVMGVQGRKPADGSAPLMKLEYEDGTTETLREDAHVEVLRDR